MDLVKKNRLVGIINKLYLSFSVLVSICVAVFGFFEVKKELTKTDRFNMAHLYLEEILEYEPKTSNLTIEESRELVALESEERRSSSNAGTKSQAEANTTHSLIDATCFNYEGHPIKRDSYCRSISDFSPGKPFYRFFINAGILVATILSLFLFRKWVSWIFR